MGAVVDIHSDHKHDYVSNNKERYQPREPLAVMLHFFSLVLNRGPSFHGHWVHHVGVGSLGVDPEVDLQGGWLCGHECGLIW